MPHYIRAGEYLSHFGLEFYPLSVDCLDQFRGQANIDLHPVFHILIPLALLRHSIKLRLRRKSNT